MAFVFLLLFVVNTASSFYDIVKEKQRLSCFFFFTLVGAH